MMEEKILKIKAVRFRNDENGYTVADAESESEMWTVVGPLPENASGRSFKLRGSVKVHPAYGEQFSISDFEEQLPERSGDIEDFLASGVVKGIGPAMAKLITMAFGDSALEVLEKEPELLLKLPGIGKKKLEIIRESFTEHKEFLELAAELTKYDISSELCMKIYRKYGSEARAVLRENPYRLARDLRGIGFRKADEIARKLGISHDNEFRVQSGIRFLMDETVRRGHSYYPKERLIGEAQALLEIGQEDAEDGLIALAYEGEYRLEEIDGETLVYSSLYYYAERNVAWRLRLIDKAELKPLLSDLKSLIAKSEALSRKMLSEEQKNAVLSSLESGVSVITGGPGTGKTTIINTLIDVLRFSGFEVAIAAPTGRAAKRISETSGNEASTVHRLLEYSFSEEGEEQYFGRNEDNPLDEDAIIIDEASMVDLMLMNALMNAIKPGCRLILVGDADQLPPVGAGSVLRDILASGEIRASKLSEIFRQAEESLIVVNAHRINSGEYPRLNSSGSDFFFIEATSDEEIAKTVTELCVSRLPAFFEKSGSFEPLSEIQVLTPTRKRELGTSALNARLQEALNPVGPGKAERKHGDTVFREGDKVMQIKNNYRLRWRRLSDFSEGDGIFNGDAGFIESVDTSSSVITVRFDDDRYVHYDFNQLDELELAYAVTVHKSQGNEFTAVVMPVSYFPPMLSTRNLLYTAVTRGKKLVVLVGRKSCLKAMVDNNISEERFSALAGRIGRLYGEDFEDLGSLIPF